MTTQKGQVEKRSTRDFESSHILPKNRQMVSGPEESAAEVTYLSMRKEPESCRIKSTFGGVLNIYKVKVGIEAIC